MTNFDTIQARKNFETLSLLDKQQKIIAVLGVIKWDVSELQELYAYAAMVQERLTDDDCVKLYDIAMSMIDLHTSIQTAEKNKEAQVFVEKQHKIRDILYQYELEDEKIHQEADDILKTL